MLLLIKPHLISYMKLQIHFNLNIGLLKLFRDELGVSLCIS